MLNPGGVFLLALPAFLPSVISPFLPKKGGTSGAPPLDLPRHTPPTEGIGISWGLSLGGLQDQHIKLDWNFQGAWKGGLRKNPFCAGGRDIF